jgi:hypothetical protein
MIVFAFMHQKNPYPRKRPYPELTPKGRRMFPKTSRTLSIPGNATTDSYHHIRVFLYTAGPADIAFQKGDRLPFSQYIPYFCRMGSIVLRRLRQSNHFYLRTVQNKEKR